MSYTDSDSDDSFDDSLSLSFSSSLSFRGKPTTKNSGKKSSSGRVVERVEPLHFRDENPPKRWVGGLESIDTEEAAFELRQQVNDYTMTSSTTQYDPLICVQDTDPVFNALNQQTIKEKQKKITKNMRKYTADSELDITSLFFDPVVFLSRVHKNTPHERLEQGIQRLATTSATRSHNIKKLVSLHFGQFVHCKDTIDLIQVLLKPELPPEHTRMDLLATRMQNLPWLLNTFTSQQQDQLYYIITNKRQQQLLQQQQQQQQMKLQQQGIYNRFSPQSQSSFASSASSNPSSQSSTPRSNRSTPTNTGAAGSIAVNDMSSPFAFALNSQVTNDKSRIGRLQLVLSTVAEKTDVIYNPLLTRRSESDQIRNALTIFRKYKLLLELPMRMRQHITNGRVDRLVHDTQRINMIRISKNPSNYLLHEALAECQSIRTNYATILLQRLSDPRHNLYSQQRTMSYLFQLEDKLDPTWYYLERQCMHIGNLLDRAYYDSSLNNMKSAFISITNPNNSSKQDLVKRAQEMGSDEASGGMYTWGNGDYEDDDLDEEYNMFHNGPSASPVGPDGSAFAQTVNKINLLTPPTSYMEYTPQMTSPQGKQSRQQQQQQQQQLQQDEFQYQDQATQFTQPLPLFLRKAQFLTQTQAELIATNLLQIFTLHIQPLLRLAYNVGNGTLFDTIKSTIGSGGSGGNGDGDIDLSRLTLNRYFINSRNLDRLTTLISHLSSKLILYLSSLCIPGLDLNELSGFSRNVFTPTQQQQQTRTLDALDLAYPSSTSSSRHNNQLNQRPRRSTIGSNDNTSNTSENNSNNSTPNNNNNDQLGRLSVYDDSALPRNISGVGQLPTREQLQLPHHDRSGLSSTSPLPPLPHSLDFSLGRRSTIGAGGDFSGPRTSIIGNNSNSGGYQPFSTFFEPRNRASLSFGNNNQMNNPNTDNMIPNFNDNGNNSFGVKRIPTKASHISSVTDDDVYVRTTALHTVNIENVKTVLPRSPYDPIRPIPVANFAHIVLHQLSSLLFSLVNNSLVLLDPKIIDPLLSFYANLYQHAQKFLSISATVQIATLKETWALNPSSIFHHNQTTVLPILFEHIVDTYLQSMVMLPNKQLLFRSLLYLNAPPQFTLISDFTELVLTFADRLHSIAIPQNPIRMLDVGDITTSTTTTVTTSQKDSNSSSLEAVLTTRTEEVVTTKVITTKTIIGKDGQKQVITSEEVLEDEITPTIDVKTTALKANTQEDLLGRETYSQNIDQGDGSEVKKSKTMTISRFGHELLSLAEQLNYNEHSVEPYSVGDVVAANAQNVYQLQSMQSTTLNSSSMINSGLTNDQIKIITAAITAGLNVDGNGRVNSHIEKGNKFNNEMNPFHQINSPGDDRTLLAVLSNCIHTTHTIIPRAWRNLAELLQQSWPAKEILEMSFFLNSTHFQSQGGSSSSSSPPQGILDTQTRMKYNEVMRNDLNNLKNKYNPTNKPGTRYNNDKNQFAVNKKSTKKVAFQTGLTSDDDSDISTTETDIDNTHDDDSSYDDLSSDLDSILGRHPPTPRTEVNVLSISNEIWQALTAKQQKYINTAVVGGLGVAMSLALDTSYRRVQGIYLQLQNIVVQRYILNKSNVIQTYIHDSLYRGGINWKKAPIPTHVREFIYTILQCLVEAKSEMVLFQNIDYNSILTTIIENSIVTWCYLVKKIHVLSYNGAMQLFLETNFISRSVNRYTTPYAVSLCQDLLNLLHAYIEETIVTEHVNTAGITQQMMTENGGIYGNNGEGFDSQLFDAVSRLGMFNTLNTTKKGNDNRKIDDNTGYEMSTSISPLHSVLTQQRDRFSQRRGSQPYHGSSRGHGGDSNEISLIHSQLSKDQRLAKQARKQQAYNLQNRIAAASLDDGEPLLDDDSDSSDGHEDDTFYDENEEDDEATLIAGVISMRDLKLYSTQQVNKDLMIQFKLHTTHIDCDNLLQQSLWATRLSFATLRIDSEDPLNTLMLEESTKNTTTSVFDHTYRTPEEVVDGYFKVRYNANRLRENIRLERSEEEKKEQLTYTQWLKQNNIVYNSSLDDNELYVNLSIGQSKKYRELVSAQRSHSSEQEMRKIFNKYSHSSTSSTQSSVFSSGASKFSSKSSASGGGMFSKTTEVIEENDPEPDDFGVKVTRLVTKRKEVVEKTKEKKERPVKEKKQRHKVDIVDEESAQVVEEKVEVEKESSSDLEDLFPPKKITPKPETPKAQTPKATKPAPLPLIIDEEEEPPAPAPPTPLPQPPTPKPTIIEERIIVTTTTTKQQQQLQLQREEEEKRRKEKEMMILSQYQKKPTNLDFLDEPDKANDEEDEFNDLDLQAMNFSYKVAKKEKPTNAWGMPMDDDITSSSSSEEDIPLRKTPLPPVQLDSTSSSDDDIPMPVFMPKVQKVKKEKIEQNGPIEVNMKSVKLQSQRQRRERKTNKKRQSDSDDDDGYVAMNFGTKTTNNKSTRTKKVDVSDVTEQQRLLLLQQQAAKKNTLKDKIVVPEMDMMVNVKDGNKGAEDTSKLTVEEKRRRQIKMRIKRTKDGKYIDLDTGEEIDPAMFKKQLGPLAK